MTTNENSRISAAKLALAVKRLRSEDRNLDLVASDPIAIIGMGCRFPGGVDTPEEFWKALKEGRDSVREVPLGRWPDAATLSPPMRRGGYLEDVEGFDAAYFGISPREAQDMDPQQRLLLEVTWEALWNAGIDPGSLAGTNAGVFIAIYGSDFSRLHFSDSTLSTAHAGVGSFHSIAAGRISFLLNIRGPNLAIDSACSSSLVATHLACQSLRTGECRTAIAGAVSLKLLSDEVLLFSKWGMLAGDGKCKTFDAAADGFGPGEGSAAIVLKRLSDALQDGDRVHAVIRGTAVNQDGRSTVLTAPNGLAQEAVLRTALHNAMLEPEDVSFVETHGTGTSLGDPIEVEAIRSVYGHFTQDKQPCVLGAVKTNLGHLEAAAGLAGLIKTVLCLEHGEIPKNLGFHRLNPEISLTGTRLKIATENELWAPGGRVRVAGISSFGLGGTNSHVIVEEAPVLSARSPADGGRQIPLPAYRWQRKKFPLARHAVINGNSSQSGVRAASASPSLHPLLGMRMDSPFIQGTLFTSEIDTTSIPYLVDHRLGDRPLLPFAAFLDMAAMAVQGSDQTAHVAIHNFVMREPCFLSAAHREFQVLRKEGSVEIASRGDSDWVTHAKGSLDPAERNAAPVDIENLRARCPRSIAPDAIYRSLEQTGLRYGASFRTVKTAWLGNGEALAHVELPEGLVAEAHRYGLHPAILDGCLQVLAVAKGIGDDGLFLPIAIDRFELERAGAEEVWVYAKITDSSADTFSGDLSIMDADGHRVAHLTGFTAKRTTRQKMESVAARSDVAQDGQEDLGLTYEFAWRMSSRTPSAQSVGRKGERWLLVETRDGSCRNLSDTLTEQGAICQVISGNEYSGSRFTGILWTGVVYDTRGLEASGREVAWRHPEKSTVEYVLEFARALAGSKATMPRLWIVSSAAVAVLPTEDVSLATAPLWGLVRTLGVEYPETRPVLIDMGPFRTDGGYEASEADSMLAEEIAAANDSAKDALGNDPMVAFRGGERYVARLVHSTLSLPVVRRLDLGASGRLDDIRIEPAERREPLPNEVEIEVRAAGLNFRDVLTALGMLQGHTSTPGGECSGVIVRVGANVRDWKVGDPVLAFALGSFQSFISVPAEWVTRKPAALTFAEAAGIPVAFLTALYGLDRLAHLSSGQSILIHAATGGLGMAAVELAMRAGAQVFATAGSPAKREVLRQLGVAHVFDSRSLAFRDQVLEATGGAGVDVVLNSLAGDFLRASFDVVAEDGCFLEVGKRGLWTHEQVAELGRNIRYFPFDLGDVATTSPEQIAGMWRELMERFGSGELHPLPTSLYPFENPTGAFRTMSQAKHIGKLVLSFRGESFRPSLRDLVSEGTVLVTGGLGALGKETARWLAANGAQKIVLASRSAEEGSNDPIVAELRSRGVNVSVERADVAAVAEIEDLLAKIRASGSPLCAVFHAAGVVRDSVLKNASWDSYCEATAPKIDGAWNLHRFTEKDSVRLMVFYSSVASVLGSPGQGSYSAGNAFLDALAHYRASRGLRTLSVNWGAWASAGMAARLASEQAARWTRQGVASMEPAHALAAMEEAIESGHTQVAVLAIDWQRFRGGGPETGARRPDAMLFEGLGTSETQISQTVSRTETVSPSEDVVQKMRSVPVADRKTILSTYIRRCARGVLGLEDSATIQGEVPLQDVGLDSLMALEMRNELASSLGVPLPAGLLFDYPSVDQLTQHLLHILAVSGDDREKVDEIPESDLSALSDLEAERLLSEELDRVEGEKTNA